jgi:hypothetical protein
LVEYCNVLPDGQLVIGADIDPLCKLQPAIQTLSLLTIATGVAPVSTGQVGQNEGAVVYVFSMLMQPVALIQRVKYEKADVV